MEVELVKMKPRKSGVACLCLEYLKLGSLGLYGAPGTFLLSGEAAGSRVLTSMGRQNHTYDKDGPPPVFHSHDAAYCQECEKKLISTEILRSGLGIAGGRYKNLCIHDGYQYYNLSADMRKP